MTNNTDTLVTFAATTRATRFWTGIDAAGHVAQFWTKEPNAADYPALAISAHVIMPLNGAGDPAGWEPVGAAPAAPAVLPASIDTPEFRKLLRKIGDWHCGLTIDEVIAKVVKHVDQHVVAALPAAAPVPESQPAALSEAQQYRTGYGEGVRAAAKLAETIDRALAEAIRDLQSTAPALPAAALPSGWHEAMALVVKGYNYGAGYYDDESFCKGLEQLFILAGVYLDVQADEYKMPAATPAPESQPAAPDNTWAELNFMADQLEDQAQPYEGDFADTVRGHVEELRDFAARFLPRDVALGPAPAMEAKSHE